MIIKKLDHLVITAKDVTATVNFYKKLGFTAKTKDNRHELHAGDFKINVHTLGKELSPHAHNVNTGCNDFCFEINSSIFDYYQQLQKSELEIELGIVERNGVFGKMKSIYLRDPDGNLVEICSYE